MEPPSFKEALVWWFITFTGTLCFIEWLVPRAYLNTCTLTGLLVEDMVEWAGRSRWSAANTLAGVAIKMLVRAAVLSLVPAPTHTLTGFYIQFFIWATHICREYICRDGRRRTHTGGICYLKSSGQEVIEWRECTDIVLLICTPFTFHFTFSYSYGFWEWGLRVSQFELILLLLNSLMIRW